MTAPVPAMAPGRGELRPILKLALPLAAAQVAQMLMSITDAAMMGHLGGTALASGSLATTVGFFLILVVQGVLTALQALIAQARGGGGLALEAIIPGGIVLALAASVPIAVLMSHIDQVLLLLGEPPDLAREALAYGRSFAWGVPGALVFWTLRNVISALERPRIVMVVVVAGALLNVALNWLLVFGHGGMPRLGLAGSGIATSIVVAAMALSLALYTVFGPVRADIGAGRPRIEAVARGLRAILHLGWAVGASYAVEMGLFSGASLLMGYFGPAAVAANQICIGVSAVTFMVPLGISQAATIRVGRHVGAGDIARARQAGRVAIVLAIGFMAVSALTIISASGLILGFYLDKGEAQAGEIAALGHRLLRIAALFQIFDGVQVVCFGVLRGFSDTKVPFYAGVFAYWGLAMPIAIGLGFGLGLGPTGIWWGFVAGLIAISSILPLRFAWLSRQEAGSPCRA